MNEELEKQDAQFERMLNGKGTEQEEEIELTDNESVEEVKQPEQPKQEPTHPNGKKIDAIKLLQQRNEARREKEAFAKELEEYKAKAKKAEEIEDTYVKLTLEKEAQEERTNFLLSNPIAKDYMADVEQLKETYNFKSYDEALRFHLANTKPELLMDRQYQNQLKSNNNLTGSTPLIMAKEEDFEKMTPEEQDKEWDRMVRSDRAKSGMIVR